MKKYQIIYVDPPYKQRKGGVRLVRPKQDRCLDYPVLGIGEIWDVLQEFEARVMFLWTIDKYLHEAELMAEYLDYHLHARMIWDKGNGVAPAFTVRYSHEYLLWFYRRPMLKIAEEQRGKWATVLREKSTRHSVKPQIAYEMIESLYPQASKIELFARQKRDGWDCWGNEVESDIEL